MDGPEANPTRQVTSSVAPPAPSDMADVLAILERGAPVDPMILANLRAEATAAAAGAYALNTVRARRADLACWVAWCAARYDTPLPARPETVAAFIAAMIAAPHAKRPTTVRRYVDTIAYLHRAAGVPDPRQSRPVTLALRGLGRVKEHRRQAAPISEAAIVQILSVLGDRLQDLRDAAVLLTTADFLGRRGEVVALQVHDILQGREGRGLLSVMRFKTASEPVIKALRHRTLQAIQRYVAAAGIQSGPLFRSLKRGGGVRDRAIHANEIGRIFRRLMNRAGLVPGGISGHSLRVGMAQELTARGATLAQLMEAGDWKSPAMPARYAERLTAERGAMIVFLETDPE